MKKRKIEIINKANSYTEEVRRSLKENYGFEKLYSQGLIIRTPLILIIKYTLLTHFEKVLKIMIEDMDGEGQSQIS